MGDAADVRHRMPFGVIEKNSCTFIQLYWLRYSDSKSQQREEIAVGFLTLDTGLPKLVHVLANLCSPPLWNIGIG